MREREREKEREREREREKKRVIMVVMAVIITVMVVQSPNDMTWMRSRGQPRSQVSLRARKTNSHLPGKGNQWRRYYH